MQVLFVGEALVGNDAVDQLSKFNQRLADLSMAPQPRAIDGILLTKFDTIDDKGQRLVSSLVNFSSSSRIQGGFVLEVYVTSGKRHVSQFLTVAGCHCF